jgi:hypothetical protein
MNDNGVFGAIFDVTSDMRRSNGQQIRSKSCGALMALTLLIALSGTNLFAQGDAPQAKPAQLGLESEASSDSNAFEKGQLKQLKAVASDGFTPVPFAVVLNKNTGQQALTDVNGNVTIWRTMTSDTLLVRSVGFLDKLIFPGQSLSASVRMVEDLISLETAQVVSEGLVMRTAHRFLRKRWQ